jgi:hypothetical protein
VRRRGARLLRRALLLGRLLVVVVVMLVVVLHARGHRVGPLELGVDGLQRHQHLLITVLVVVLLAVMVGREGVQRAAGGRVPAGRRVRVRAQSGEARRARRRG